MMENVPLPAPPTIRKSELSRMLPEPSTVTVPVLSAPEPMIMLKLVTEPPLMIWNVP